MFRQRAAAALAVFLLCVAATPASKAPKKPSTTRRATANKPAAIAPDVVPHNIAMFLAGLCNDGQRSVNVRARAMGTHFFIEEPVGVSVYTFEGTGYRKNAFMPGAKLPAALKRYEASSKN